MTGRGVSRIGGAGGGTQNAAVDLTFYRNLPPGGFPPPKAPQGHGPIPPNCLITLRNPGHKMNLS